MKKIFLVIHMLMVASGMLGCSFGNSENDQTRIEDENRRKIKGEYAQVQGTYEGYVYTNSVSNSVSLNSFSNSNILDGRMALKSTSGISVKNEQKIPIKIWVYQVENAANKSNSGLKYVPALKVKYRQLNSLKMDTLMEGDFKIETAEFMATDQKTLTIQGQKKRIPVVADGKEALVEGLEGKVILNSAGVLGDFQVFKTSNEGFADPNQEEKEYRNRLYQAYLPLVGNYTGVIDATELGGWGTSVTLSFKIIETLQNNIMIPVLKGYFTRQDIPEYGDQNFDVILKTESDPMELILNSAGGNARYSLSISAVLSTSALGKTEIIGPIYDSKKYLGVMKVTKEK